MLRLTFAGKESVQGCRLDTTFCAHHRGETGNAMQVGGTWLEKEDRSSVRVMSQRSCLIRSVIQNEYTSGTFARMSVGKLH